ncbi:hypothetical protein MJD09_14255 [bacterium]|nr:hypothetical protein [bacterium]
MKINLRWLIQAAAFIGCIYFFLQIWEGSKELIVSFSAPQLAVLGLYGLLFLVCFFVMAITSYLKQKFNGTLKNPVAIFEKLLSKVGLT